ncbi:MAG: ABC-F family ATP-binding cassette domain-containing protein [Candidatus Babeliales bacterium]
MIQAHNLCLSFGKQKIFDHISFTISQSQRIGLVGRNGSGKSTLLKALQHPEILDSGSVAVIKGKKLAYMPQEVVLQSDKSILEETCTTFGDLEHIKKLLSELEPLLEHNPDTATVHQYADLQEQLMQHDEERIRARAKKMLMGLGFAEQQFDVPVSTLSVGWKMRVVLAKLLLQDADFYLFDEPTNHLDLMTKEWFLQFLKTAPFGFMLVCHERYFLDELCSHILELEYGKGTMYTGNYSSYVVQKEHAQELLIAAYEQQQKEIAQKTATIERFRAKASKAKMAQSMIKSLDKIERITIPPGPKNVSFIFSNIQQPGKVVLTVHDVGQSFGAKKIFEHVSFEINRGEKIAVIAPNGGGKTTLFNIVTGNLPLQTGSMLWGHNVHHAIFAQDQSAILDGEKTILENIKEQCPKKTEQAIRTMLGSFLFSNDDVNKKVKILSGGEKNRVGMTTILLQDANVLLLDEPTNHLDIQSKEILLKALQNYTGTIIFVSHDRDFINDLATHILELTPHGASKYVGNYDSYHYQKNMVASGKTTQKEQSAPKAEASPTGLSTFELRKKSQALERKIEKLEEWIKQVEMKFADLVYGTEEFTKAQANLVKLRKDLASAMTEWEEIQEKLLV